MGHFPYYDTNQCMQCQTKAAFTVTGIHQDKKNIPKDITAEP